MVLFSILYLLLLFINVKTKSSELLCLSQILQFMLYSWSVWQGSSAQKTCGEYPFIPEEQSSLESASLDHMWHHDIFLDTISLKDALQR